MPFKYFELILSFFVREKYSHQFTIFPWLHYRIGELGLKVNISEMDVRVSKLEASPEVKTTAQKQIYHDIIAAALSEQAFDGLYLWGFSDRHVSDKPDIFIKSINHKILTILIFNCPIYS